MFQLRANIFQQAHPQYQRLHRYLEVEYNPLKLCTNVQTIVEHISATENNPLMQYIEALQDVTLVRLVRQVSQVYQTITFARFMELAKFATSFKLERTLVDCVRHNDMQITIDHKEKMVMFGTDLSESQREDHHDGPTLQSMPSEQVRAQLVNMSVVLHRAIAAINPNRQKADRDALRAQMVALYHENKVREHQSILIRQKLIEDRKEAIERLNTEREEAEARQLEEIQRQQKLAEQERLKMEADMREQKRRENETNQIKKRTMHEKIQQMSQTTMGAKFIKIIEEKGLTADPDEIAKEEQKELQRERKELQSRLKSQDKKVDYFERAKRLEEVPLIKDYLKDKAIKEEEFWKKQEATRIENAIAERKNAVAQQERLKRMYADRDAYMNQLKAERKNLHLEKLQRFNEALEVERKRRLAQRVNERREQRRQKWRDEREAERQRIREEEQREREEIQRMERERREKERELELEKLKKQTEMQRAREEAAEAKIRERNEKAMAQERSERDRDRDRDESSAWRPVGRDTGREPAKEGVWRSATVRTGESGGAAAGGEQGKWRSMGGDKDDGGFRRRDDGFKKGGRDRDSGPIMRRGDDRDRDAPIRRGGDDAPIRRGGDDAPIRRSGDDAPIRRSGDDAPMRRGGDDRDRDAPIRRGEDFRRGGDDRDRGGFKRNDGGFKRNTDRGGFKDDRGPRRGGDDNTNWRQAGGERPKDEASSWRRDGDKN